MWNERMKIYTNFKIFNCTFFECNDSSNFFYCFNISSIEDMRLFEMLIFIIGIIWILIHIYLLKKVYINT